MFEKKVEPRRIAGIDMARGLAVFGMLWVHISPQMAPWVPAVVVMLPDGHSSILFAVLAGVSLTLMCRTPKHGGAISRAAYRRIALRGAAVFVLGVILIVVGTPIAVILTYYGVLFVVALLFVQWSFRSLTVAAAVTAVFGPVVQVEISRLMLPSGLFDRIESWDPLNLVPSTGLIDLLFTGAYPTLTWIPFILAGMAVGRLRLGDRRFGSLISVGLILAIAAPILSGVALTIFGLPSRSSQIEEIGGVWVPPWASLLYNSPHSGTPFEITEGIGVALIVLDVCLVSARRLSGACRPVVAVGAMSLTVYVLQALALDLPGLSFDGTDSIWVLLTFVLASSTLAMTWLSSNDRGPLESLLHVISQPRAGGRTLRAPSIPPTSNRTTI